VSRPCIFTVLNVSKREIHLVAVELVSSAYISSGEILHWVLGVTPGANEE